MGKSLTIQVVRYDPDADAQPHLETYEVPSEEGATVMDALLHIRDHVDPSLGFRYGCRDISCGLCGLDIGGKPRLACNARLEDGMVVRPLSHLPVVRDLIVDRRWLMPFLRRLSLYVPDSGGDSWPARYLVPDEYSRLIACNDCLCCLAACPTYEHGRDDRAGPYHFVKLAQLHWDPRNTVDRPSQAAELGISRCVDCRRCYCPQGVPIYKAAIEPLRGA